MRFSYTKKVWPVCALLLFLFPNILTQQNPSVSQTPPSDVLQVRAEIHRVEQLLPTLADRGPALYLLATDYAHLGEYQKALLLLRQCISLDEGYDPSPEPALQPLKSNPEFRSLVEEVHRRHPPVHRARLAFAIAQKDLIPEGLAFDAERHIFYMGSLHYRKIVKITQSGEVSDFVSAKKYSLLPVVGVHVDPLSHDVWTATAADDNIHSELVHFDEHGSLIGRFIMSSPGQHLFNDLALRNSREAYLTDSLSNQVLRFDFETHTFTPMAFPRPLLYPNGIALSLDGKLLYVADAFGVLQLNLVNNLAREVNPGPSNTLAGIDGMYFYKGSLVAVQNGIGSARIVVFRLSPDGLRATSIHVLEYRSPLVVFPTTGAIDGSNFYFMTDTQVRNLDNGKIIDPSKLKPLHIALVPLK